MTAHASIRLPMRIADRLAAERFFASLAEEAVEVLAFAYLDKDQRVLGMRQSRSAARDTHDVPVREVLIDALAAGACGVVMAHNHPSGDPSPSKADHDATWRVARALDPLGVRLLDHVIVARGGTTSFRAMGLL